MVEKSIMLCLLFNCFFQLCFHPFTPSQTQYLPILYSIYHYAKHWEHNRHDSCLTRRSTVWWVIQRSNNLQISMIIRECCNKDDMGAHRKSYFQWLLRSFDRYWRAVWQWAQHCPTWKICSQVIQYPQYNICFSEWLNPSNCFRYIFSSSFLIT